MKKFILAFALLLALASMGFAHGHGGGGHNPEPGHGGGRGCVISGDFHNYDGDNISCDGTGAHIGEHHRGTTVNAGLPRDHVFDGGFCIKAGVDSGNALKIQYKNLVEHDKVWLCSGDNTYYAIDKKQGDHFIDVLDNSWSDRNPALGQVEADVLFSKAGGSPSDNTSGGGCNSFPAAVLFVLFIPVMGKFLHKFSITRS